MGVAASRAHGHTCQAPPLIGSGSPLLACLLAWQLPGALGAGKEQETRGNPDCWSGQFNFESCCASEAAGHAVGCWTVHFNYELCCLTPFRPSEQCLHAQGPEEQLWHCRVRPHREFDRCLGSALPAQTMGSVGTLGRFPGSGGTYDQYVQAQREKADRELREVFASPRALEVVGEYLRRHFRTRTRLRGVCHGAKVGKEVRHLSQYLNRQGEGAHSVGFAENVYVLGTDISAKAARRSNGTVMLLDFHMVYMDWKGSWDFVYSNTLDHSYSPGSALLSWRWSIKGTDGIVVLHRSPYHTAMHIDAVDLYGGSMGDYCALLRLAGFEILDIVRLPRMPPLCEEDLIFAARGPSPDRFSMETVDGAVPL